MKITLPAITPWIVDECPDANGFSTVAIDDGSLNGSTEEQPVATVYDEANAQAISALPVLLEATKLALIHATHCTDPTVTAALNSALLKAGATIEV